MNTQQQQEAIDLQKQALINIHGNYISIAEAQRMIRTSVDEFTGKLSYEKLTSGG